MPRQLRLTAFAPPTLPTLNAERQDTFDFDTRRVVMQGLTVIKDDRSARIPLAGATGRVERLGRQPIRISIRARVYVPEWYANSSREQRNQVSLLYPLNLWYRAGNRVSFLGEGYTDIPSGQFRIARIEQEMPLHFNGAVWLAHYRMEFEGGS